MKKITPAGWWRGLTARRQDNIIGFGIIVGILCAGLGIGLTAAYYSHKGEIEDHERWTAQCKEADGEVRVITDEAHCFVNGEDVSSWHLPN